MEGAEENREIIETNGPEESEDSSWVHKVWSILYLALYPVVLTFSLLFFGLSYVLSMISRLIRKLLERINLPNQ